VLTSTGPTLHEAEKTYREASELLRRKKIDVTVERLKEVTELLVRVHAEAAAEAKLNESQVQDHLDFYNDDAMVPVGSLDQSHLR